MTKPFLTPRFFEILGPELWGDFGDVLVGGSAWPREIDGEERLCLERTGPFVPPITIPGGLFVVVTSDLKTKLECRFGFSSFRPVVLDKIVELRWEEWDLESENPAVWPPGPEPEDYIDKLELSPNAAAQIGELWQLLLSPGAAGTSERLADPGCYKDRIDVSTWNGNQFFSLMPAKLRVVTEDVKLWLEEQVPRWVSFREIEPL